MTLLSHSYRTSLVIWDHITHCCLPPNTMNAPRLNPFIYSIYIPRRDGRLS